MHFQTLRSFARQHILTSNTLRYRIELRALLALIESIPEKNLGKSVLDAGAGSGEITLRMMKLGLCENLIGIEPCAKNFQILQENFKQYPQCRCIRADLEKIPLQDAAVDSVVSTQVFEHIEDHETAASEVARVCASGGYALISTPHPPEIFPNEGHVRPGYTVEQMTALFESVGFKFLDCKYFLTLATLNRGMKSVHLGHWGKLLPISWADREKDLTQNQIKEQQPYGIACLFRKL